MEKFVEMTTTVKDLERSYFVIEQYSTNAVKEIEEDSTAVPNRGDGVIL